MKSHLRIYQKYTLFFFLLCSAFTGSRLMAEESKAPQNKAVLETSKTDGFKLSKKAVQTIGVTTKQIEVNSDISLPKDALVHSLDQIAVYRLRNDWFKLVSVELVRESGSQVTVHSSELKSGDQVATSGVALLRVSEMEAFGGGE